MKKREKQKSFFEVVSGKEEKRQGVIKKISDHIYHVRFLMKSSKINRKKRVGL